ncbi:uncharacterized protein LOC124141135 [Haliotis rufescens]|uniref:uncharacterized protein LOC124141135 n=1 Tax=Haliotis rufescens TaxID=6454 RepID=UPI00201EC1E3|nr:uncharacterized protein LOC124141135 [Haliotis rufescens]XP_048248214.1 uncharacterized protein LOC124141135 [Haliotis rufescens]
MSQSEVFRPANGDLYVRDPVANGVPVSADAFRKTTLQRPATHSGYRFGKLSHNSFFTRHNPHPNRVRHLKGLLDIPICSVNDDGYFASPRYSLQFPPNSYNTNKLSNSRIPVNAINVNSQLYPINTITGLQYFTGLNSFPFREKAIPKVGMVPVTEAWRDELKAFTEQLNAAEERKRDQERPRTTQYSAETGRLIPPPSRNMSRGASRRGRPQFVPSMQHIAAEPDIENMVLTMLCQILQTEDINAVQSWLVSAGDREKTMVLDMIRTVVAGREEYNHQLPAEVVGERPRTVLPPINDRQIIGESNDDNMIDRLTLVDEPVIPKGPSMMHRAVTMDPVETMPGIPAVPPPQADPAMPVPAPSPPHIPMKPSSPKAIIEDDEIPIKPPTNEVFKHMTSRPPTQGGRISAANDMRPPGTADARLKYTKSPFVNGPVPDNMWKQQQSINNNTF